MTIFSRLCPITNTDSETNANADSETKTIYEEREQALEGKKTPEGVTRACILLYFRDRRALRCRQAELAARQAELAARQAELAAQQNCVPRSEGFPRGERPNDGELARYHTQQYAEEEIIRQQVMQAAADARQAAIAAENQRVNKIRRQIASVLRTYKTRERINEMRRVFGDAYDLAIEQNQSLDRIEYLTRICAIFRHAIDHLDFLDNHPGEYPVYYTEAYWRQEQGQEEEEEEEEEDADEDAVSEYDSESESESESEHEAEEWRVYDEDN